MLARDKQALDGLAAAKELVWQGVQPSGLPLWTDAKQSFRGLYRSDPEVRHWEAYLYKLAKMLMEKTGMSYESVRRMTGVLHGLIDAMDRLAVAKKNDTNR